MVVIVTNKESREGCWRRFRKLTDNITLPGFDPNTTRSLFLISEDTRFRRGVQYIVGWGYPFISSYTSHSFKLHLFYTTYITFYRPTWYLVSVILLCNVQSHVALHSFT